VGGIQRLVFLGCFQLYWFLGTLACRAFRDRGKQVEVRISKLLYYFGLGLRDG
jgi:hypothetical protein